MLFNRKKYRYFLTYVMDKDGKEVLRSVGYDAASKIKSTYDIYCIERDLRTRYKTSMLYILDYKKLKF